MIFESKYENMMKDQKVKRWFENLKAKSILTATVYRRTLRLYCNLQNTTPDKILKEAKKPDFRDTFMDFVRKLEKEGKAGSYIIRFKKVIRSWLKFNGINTVLDVNIANENVNPTIMDERVPTKEELSKLFRNASARGRVAISMLAFSGLRPESLGNYDGTDGLKLSDLKDFNIEKMEFEKIPAIVHIRPNLSKGRNSYFTFISEEAAIYIKEYLDARIKEGEKLSPESPLLQLDTRGIKKNNFLRTNLVTRDIRDAIASAGLKMRPYVLRAYFATALDIAESKGLISHPWRMFIMGHKGDIEARYSTNKKLPPDMIEEMRESYKKCTKFFETRISGISENDAKLYLQQQLLLAVGYKQDEIDKMDLSNISNEEFQNLLKNKVTGAMLNNGTKQKVVLITEVPNYIKKGYEFVAKLDDKTAIVKLPF